MRKLISVLLVLVALPLALSACGPDAQGSTTSKKEAAAVAPKAPVSHVGTWKAEGFEANIAAHGIEVNVVTPDMKALFWKGTFSDINGTVNSTGDREALDTSMFGSSEKVKPFTVSDDEIVFEFSMMGTTRTIHLKKA